MSVNEKPKQWFNSSVLRSQQHKIKIENTQSHQRWKCIYKPTQHKNSLLHRVGVWMWARILLNFARAYSCDWNNDFERNKNREKKESANTERFYLYTNRYARSFWMIQIKFCVILSLSMWIEKKCLCINFYRLSKLWSDVYIFVCVFEHGEKHMTYLNLIFCSEKKTEHIFQN